MSKEQIKKVTQREIREHIKLTLQQWSQLHGFMAKYDIEMGRICLSYDNLVSKLNIMLNDWSKKKKYETNKIVQHFIGDIRKLIKECNIMILPKTPPFPKGVPKPPPIPPEMRGLGTFGDTTGKKGIKLKQEQSKRMKKIMDKIEKSKGGK